MSTSTSASLSTSTSTSTSTAAEMDAATAATIAAMGDVDFQSEAFLEDEYELSRAQQSAIEAEIKQTQPLIAKPTGFDILLTEYKDNPKFIGKIKNLSTRYSTFRRVRGDGSCFYRSYLFGIFELCSRQHQLAEKLVTFIQDSFDVLCKTSPEFDAFTLEDFYSLFLEQVTWLRDEKPTVEGIEEKLNSDISDWLVTYLRFLTSGHLIRHADNFLPYLPDGVTMQEFIKSDVNPTYKDADYIQCVALSTEMDIGVQIEYLDQTDGEINHHTLPHTHQPQVFLLYRPGHYDVLYPATTPTTTTAVAS